MLYISIGHHLSYIYEAAGLSVQAKGSSIRILQEKDSNFRPTALVLAQVGYNPDSTMFLSCSLFWLYRLHRKSDGDAPEGKFVRLEETNNYRVYHFSIQSRLDASTSPSLASGQIPS